MGGGGGATSEKWDGVHNYFFNAFFPSEVSFFGWCFSFLIYTSQKQILHFEIFDSPCPNNKGSGKTHSVNS